MGKYSELHIQLQDELMNLSTRAEEGEITNLDALLEMRSHREEFEKSMALIKDFEETKINEIANEAGQYPEGYHGFEIKAVNGRKTFSYKGIAEVESLEEQLKSTKEKYSSAFEGIQKGNTTLDELPDGKKGWVSPDGETLPLPDLTIGKSFITVKKKR